MYLIGRCYLSTWLMGGQSAQSPNIRFSALCLRLSVQRGREAGSWTGSLQTPLCPGCGSLLSQHLLGLLPFESGLLCDCLVMHSVLPQLDAQPLEARGFQGLALPSLGSPFWAGIPFLRSGFAGFRWVHVLGGGFPFDDLLSVSYWYLSVDTFALSLCTLYI